MHVRLVTPAPPRSRAGNRTTANRWARLLREAGHRVTVAGPDSPVRDCDLLIALHANKSAGVIAAFHARFPDRPIVLALTGTDLYRDLARSAAARRSLEIASRYIVLQPLAIEELPARLRSRARVVIQSATAPKSSPQPPSSRTFDVCVIGHLRTVKDPLRAAMASRFLDGESRIRILHAGAALTPAMKARALRESRFNPRYEWLGELSEARVARLLQRSRLMVLSSRLEGGANVISEAIACGTPVLASRIPGSVGLLGEDYRGYFPTGDTRALAAMLSRCERDPSFLQSLRESLNRLRPRFAPSLERASLESLIAELVSPEST